MRDVWVAEQTRVSDKLLGRREVQMALGFQSGSAQSGHPPALGVTLDRRE